MNVFNHNILVSFGQVKVREIPESLYAALHQQVGALSRSGLGNAQHGYLGAHNCGKIRHAVHTAYLYAAHGHAYLVFVRVENAAQLHAVFLEIYVNGKRPAQVSRTYEDDLFPAVKSQYLAYLRPKLRQIVAVALLTEAAEAVKILTYL